MISIDSIDKNGQEAWDAYVNAHPQSTHYHLFGWRTIIEEAFGHRAFYLAALNTEKKICGILPLVHMRSSLFGSFLVSMPFLNYGGLLCDDPDVEEALLHEAERIMQETSSSFLELRHTRDHGHSLDTKTHKVSMFLHLESTRDTQWKTFDAKLRNQISKSEKSQLSSYSGGGEAIADFYPVFAHNMRDLGTPVYGKNFFSSIIEAFPKTTRVFLVRRGRTPVAAGIAVWHKNTFEMPWASSIKRYKAYCPNNKLYWDAITYAIEHNFTSFDFGRSTPGGGTYRFKAQWGAKSAQLYWQYRLNAGQALPEISPSNRRYRLMVYLWRHMPLVVANRLGPCIVKHIP